MGCDIHAFAEVLRDGRWDVVGDVFPLDEVDRTQQHKTYGNEPFSIRNYDVFGFLADVRTRDVPPICAAKGLPTERSARVNAAAGEWDLNRHSHSWLTLRELLTAEALSPAMRDHLGDAFFADLDVLKTLGPPDDVRVVFCFDN